MIDTYKKLYVARTGNVLEINRFNKPQWPFSKALWNSIFTILFVMSVENISLFHSVLDEALE